MALIDGLARNGQLHPISGMGQKGATSSLLRVTVR
jgi:hypothetical protein